MENNLEATSDLLNIFESDHIEVTASNVAKVPSTNVSNVLGEINTNNLNMQDDDLLQILSGNTNQRPSNRRSSILKISEQKEIRRSSVRRISWAPTYQFQELRTDGTTLIASQELNKYGPEPLPIRKSAELRNSITNENVAPNVIESQSSSQNAPSASNKQIDGENSLHPLIDDPFQEKNLEVIQKVKQKVKNTKNLTRILSKYYDKEEVKDCQTVINTAVNRFNIDPTTTDLNQIFTNGVTNKPEIVIVENDSDAHTHVNNIIQQFLQQPQQPPQPQVQPAVKEDVFLSAVAKHPKLPNISPISGNIKSNLDLTNDTMNGSSLIYNSTKIGIDQPTPQEYWNLTNAGDDASLCGQQSEEELKRTIHDTTMMVIDDESSDEKSNAKTVVTPVELEEEKKDASAFLALLKGNNEPETATNNTDTFEFSFQMQTENDENAPVEPKLMANNSNKENDLPDLIPSLPSSSAVAPTTKLSAAHETSLLGILGTTTLPDADVFVRGKTETLMLPNDLTLGNLLEVEKNSSIVPQNTATISSSRSSGLTMEITDVIEQPSVNESMAIATSTIPCDGDFSVFKDITTIDATNANDEEHNSIKIDACEPTKMHEDSQKENAFPLVSKPKELLHQSPIAITNSAMTMTMDITTKYLEQNENPFIQQLIASKKNDPPSGLTMDLTTAGEQSMMMTTSEVTTLAVDEASLSIFKDPSMVQSPVKINKIGQELMTNNDKEEPKIDHSGEKSQLDFTLSDSLIDSQKENQVPFHRFQQKQQSDGNESQVYDISAPALPASPQKESFDLFPNSPIQTELSAIPTSSMFDISMAATTANLPDFSNLEMSDNNLEPFSTNMEITDGATLANMLGGDESATKHNEVSMALDVDEQKSPKKCETIENCLRIPNNASLDLINNDENCQSNVTLPKKHMEKSLADSILFRSVKDVSFEMSTAKHDENTGMFGTTNNLMNILDGGDDHDEHSLLAGDNSTMEMDGMITGGNVDPSILLKEDLSVGHDNDLSAQFSDIKVEVFEITKNMDTDEMTGENDCEGKTPYARTKPFLGKSASTILDEEMEFTDSIQGTLMVSNEIDLDNKQKSLSVVEEESVDSPPQTCDVPETQLDNDVELEKRKDEEEPKDISEQMDQVPTRDESKIISPPSKRPYDFTMADMPQQQQQSIASKFSKRSDLSSASVLSTPSLAKTGLLSNLTSFSHNVPSRIPTIRSGNTTNLHKFSALPSISSLQTSGLRSATQLRSINSSSIVGPGRNTTTTTSLLSNVAPTSNIKTAEEPATLKQQIELDFNLSKNAANKSADTSRNNLTSLTDDSLNSNTFSSYLVKNCVRKSLAVGLSERLRDKVELLKREREKQEKTELLPPTIVDDDHQNEVQHGKTNDLTKPVTVTISAKSKDGVTTMNASTLMDITPMECNDEVPDQSMAIEEQNSLLKPDQEQFSVKLRSNTSLVDIFATKTEQPIQPEQLEEEVVEEEPVLEEEAKTNCFDISNFTMPDISLDSDGEADFENELANGTDSNGDEEGLNLDGDDDESSNVDLKHILEVMSHSIHNSTVMNETTSQHDISKSPLGLNSTQAQIKRIRSATFDFTKYEDFLCNMSFDDTDSIEFRSSTSSDPLYNCISNLKINELHIRVHSMQPNLCVVRYLWGTLEVRIKFEPANKDNVRPMSFDTYSYLSRKKEIPYKVMRGLEDRALHNGDEMFLSYNEEHRPILGLAHNYILSHIHDKYHDLIKKYPDSSKLSDLLTEFSNTANAARKMAVELRHIYSREITQLQPLDREGKFRFSVVLLGVRLSSSFEVAFAFDPLMYPYEVIHPTIVVPDKDKHLYGPIEQFNAALLLIKPGNFEYLTNLIRGARLYIKALRTVLLHNLRLKKQKEQICAARLST